MKRDITYKIILALCFFFVCVSSLSAQKLLRKISLKQQIENSSLVVEGEVISKKSFWNEDNGKIYTSNIIKVYKVFKGELINTIEVVTRGGTIGMQSQLIVPNLKLNKGDLGIFTLHKNNVISSNKVSDKNKFTVYSSLQGFYKYNLNKGTVMHPFKSGKSTSNSLYDDIKLFTKAEYTELSNLSTQKTFSKTSQTLAPSAISFSPTTITAGTKSTITITIPGGSTGDFGIDKGKVSFSNGDDGGDTFIDALDTQVTWSASSITVEVPSGAGTGKIMVTDNASNSIISTEDLTIPYSEINAEFEVPSNSGNIYAYQTRHVNNDGSGGYIFNMQTSFNANTAAKTSFLTALDTWRCETGVNFTIGNTVSNDSNGVNIIRFDVGSELPVGTLGEASYSFLGCRITNEDFGVYTSEIDIVFDDGEDWYYGVGSQGLKYDFQSVALHELGHAHQLAHVIDNSPFSNNGNDVMHYAIGSNEEQRVLSVNNITAANDVQSRSESSFPSNFSCFDTKSPMVTYSCPLNVEDKELNNTISIYPNPSSGQFYIKNESFINLEKVVIYDVSGRLISNINISNSSRIQTITLTGISKGIYIVNIHSDNSMITKKIVFE
ncbi:T9SS type A sorting domain-containing protein [Thalassobellus suaedae]|uniref:T9SS type A sorting domain-containing protein n=1 Tax=Thalassobellus suaedae TaxID=3074124 RepID=A0ABY9XRA4_9FLAO|nr:T9SS type A sorting domain-containing protein [Flavobacteriaceae bacterium HL-DH14]